MDTTNLTDSQVVASPDAKMSGWKKIVLLLVGIVILAIVVIISIPGFLNLSAKDIPPINDADLLLKKVIVSDSENTYFDLIKLDKIIYGPEGSSNIILDMVSGKVWDEKIAEEIVLRNIQAFVIFAEAARKPKFQDPASSDPANMTPNIVLPSMNTWRKMARLSAIRAMHLSRQGKDKEAMDEALNSVKIGQKIQQSQVLFIEYLVAMAMKSVGLETLHRVVASSKLSGTEFINYAKELNAFYKNEDGLINSFKGEYQIGSWTMDALAGGNKEVLKEILGEENSEIVGKVKNNYYFQPNKTKALLADHTRSQIKTVSEPCGAIKEIEIPKLAPQSYIKLYLTENAIGKIIYDIGAASLTSVSIKKCQEDLLVAATQAIISVKAFKKDSGKYPDLLNELAPRYLASVPIDPFDGKPLKYFAAKKIIYSVGQDMKDSGGSIGDDWRQMSDPTFKLGF